MWYLFRFSRDPPCARSYCGDLCRRLRDLVSFEDIGELGGIWAPVGRFEYVLTHGVAWHGTASCVIAWHGMLRHAGESSRDVWRQFERNPFVSKTYVFFMTSSQHSFTENIFRCFRSHRYFKWNSFRRSRFGLRLRPELFLEFLKIMYFFTDLHSKH